MDNEHYIMSPTGSSVRRVDKWGSGRYGASRGVRLHAGADFIAMPGQGVMAPIAGHIEREARPYPNEVFSGVLMRAAWVEIKMFYFEPYRDMIGTDVSQGEVIGIAQDLQTKYPGITPHIHLEIESIDPEILLQAVRKPH